MVPEAEIHPGEAHGVMRRTSSKEDTVPIFDIDETDISPHEIGGITYFGTDFDVHGLVRRLDDRDIIIPTFDPEIQVPSRISGFQRGFVWSKPQMDRFIESLLLGFPVPGVFFVQEPDNSLLVLDGQQRLRTLAAFYRGIHRDRIFKLDQVEDQFVGITYETLNAEDRRRLDNTFIHATVVGWAPGRNSEAVYQIFERLNTGGTNLQPHEIRVALFHGEFVSLLRTLNDTAAWRTLYGNRSIRLKDQELILRFFALWLDGTNYSRPLKTFLNDFLEANRHLDGWPVEDRESLFIAITEAIVAGLGKGAFRIGNAVNAALCDAVMVGVADRFASGPLANTLGMRDAYESLLADESFRNAITRATADEDSVELRLRLAKKAFSRV